VMDRKGTLNLGGSAYYFTRATLMIKLLAESTAVTTKLLVSNVGWR
jgi:hypothetical protein